MGNGQIGGFGLLGTGYVGEELPRGVGCRSAGGYLGGKSLGHGAYQLASKVLELEWENGTAIGVTPSMRFFGSRFSGARSGASGSSPENP